VIVEFPTVLVLNGSERNLGTKELFQWKSTNLEIYDFQGKRLLEKEIIKSLDHFDLDVSSWQRGLYYFRLVYDKQTAGGQKVIISAQ
jgi:hypothetical protein